MVSFWKIKVHQRFWYTMRKLNSELTLATVKVINITSWEEPHEIFLALAVKDVILMGDHTRIWLALAEQ